MRRLIIGLVFVIACSVGSPLAWDYLRPRYDLQISYDDWDYRFIARDLPSLDACRAHLPSPRPLTYKCLEWSRWSADTNTYTKYNSTYR